MKINLALLGNTYPYLKDLKINLVSFSLISSY
jgi:hypothetical protein